MTAALTHWEDSAECLRETPELFFPVSKAPHLAEPAKTICRRCPVLRDCLAFALTHDVEGVWGATTDLERSALRSRHGLVAEPITVQLLRDSLFDATTVIDRGGASAEEVAVQLGLTPRTIQRHRAARRDGRTIRHWTRPESNQP